MDAELRELRRKATAGDVASRRRLRLALERSGQKGGFEGLAVGDRVELRSCLPGPERVWRGVVRGSTPDGVPVVIAEVTFDGETKEADVTGCPSCSVELLDEDARPAKREKKPKTAPPRPDPVDLAIEHQLRAQELGRNEDHEGAVRLLQKAAKLCPDLADTWRQLGHHQLALGRLRSALESVRRALILEPPAGRANFGEPLRLQGEILAALGRHAEAIESLEAGLALMVYGKAPFVRLIRASRKALASSSRAKAASPRRRAKR